MNYQLIILVKDMEVARGAVALLESGGVDAYLEDRTDYTQQPIKIEWGVMVDGSKVNKAKKLLSQFINDKKIEYLSSNSDDDVNESPELGYDPNSDVSWSYSQLPRQSSPSYNDDSNDFSLWKLLLGLFAIAVLLSKIIKYFSFTP